MAYSVISLNPGRNVSLTCCFHRDAAVKRPAVLVIPGGGYQNCSDREAENVASLYVQAGFHGFVLRYSVAEHKTWPNPLVDYQQAMTLIRQNADSWGVIADQIAVIGFSAGGHLAAAAATLSQNRPNAAILGYAVTGGDVKLCNPTAPDTIAAVDGNTCPCFLFATRNDDLVPIRNTIGFAGALAEAGISFESHIYSFGPHGFSLCTPGEYEIGRDISARVPQWAEDSIGWLRELFGGEGMPPVCRPRVNSDREPFFSADCSIGCLMGNPVARQLLKSLFPVVPEELKVVSLRSALGHANLAKQAEALDAQLRQIPNQEAVK